MSSTPTSPTDLSDAQLADLVRFVARTCLEVERGLRPPDHLRRLMDSPSARAWQPREMLGRFRGGPVRPADIGPAHVSRLADDEATATLITRTQADRWAAVVLKLRVGTGRWQLVDLQRLLASSQQRTHGAPAVQVPVEADLDEQVTRVSEDRRMAAAALVATNRRHGDLKPGDPGYRTAGDQARSWRRALAQLDVELDALNRRARARRSVAQARHR